MASDVAVVTMVRDDEFFLQKWVEYYGGLFGRKNLYVVNHGFEEMVDRVADGCNIIGLPGHAHKGFDNKRWRLLNGLVNGLRSYYSHVIVGDVDEFVVTDPNFFPNLKHFLAKKRPGRVFTPIGLDVVHLRDKEPEPVTPKVLGPRRFVRHNAHYSKPCIISCEARAARGGHYTTFDRLFVPEGLYLLHLKYCDFGMFRETLDRRNDVVEAIREKRQHHIMAGAHWFKENRQDDETYAGFDQMPIETEFGFNDVREKMHATWERRGDTPLWHFAREDASTLHELPERFFGLF